jgi:hypothetical protein
MYCTCGFACLRRRDWKAYVSTGRTLLTPDKIRNLPRTTNCYSWSVSDRSLRIGSIVGHLVTVIAELALLYVPNLPQRVGIIAIVLAYWGAGKFTG